MGGYTLQRWPIVHLMVRLLWRWFGCSHWHEMRCDCEWSVGNGFVWKAMSADRSDQSSDCEWSVGNDFVWKAMSADRSDQSKIRIAFVSSQTVLVGSNIASDIAVFLVLFLCVVLSRRRRRSDAPSKEFYQMSVRFIVSGGYWIETGQRS
jgi:hypothetical protein